MRKTLLVSCTNNERDTSIVHGFEARTDPSPG